MMRVSRAAPIVLSLLSALMILRSIVFVLRHYTPEAFFDSWLWVGDFQLWAGHHYTLHDLIKPHYGQHRIATARVVLLLDSILFRMRGLSVVLVNLGLLAGVGLLLWRAARADGVSRTGWSLPALFWVALMVSVAQVENLIFPFQVQWGLLCLGIVAAAALLSHACAVPGWRAGAYAAAAALAGVLAMYSMAGGVLAVPGLIVLLVLRQARPVVWLVYLPLSALGMASFFMGYPSMPRAPLLDAGLAVTRVFYVGNFLASVLTPYPGWAAYPGLAALALFVAACWALMARTAREPRPVASGDAALVAVGAAICLCGLAASMTSRVTIGAQAALVSRYATMSLLFAGVLLGLYGRWGARAGWPAGIGGVVLPVSAGVLLLVVNAPAYDVLGAGWQGVVLRNVQLLRNNVGIDGPTPVIFFGTVNDVRDRVRFLHAQGINMFVPEEGPPAALLARLRQAGLASLPVCRGYVDEAFAIDDAAFLVKGWLADPEGRHTLGWVGAVDDQGNVLGTSRALTQRQDVAAALHMAQPAVGFETGFRLLPPARFGVLTAAVRIVGLDPGGKPPLCTLSQPVMIGPVHVSPIETMGALSPLAGSAASAIGFAPDSTTRLPFQGPAWSAAATRDIDATLRFGLHEAAGADHAVIVPFKGGEGAAAGEVAFRMGDGSLLRQSIGWPWDRPAWRAAVLPPEVVQAHRGVQDVTVTVRPGMIVMVGAPLEAVLRPGWSRLF